MLVNQNITRSFFQYWCNIGIQIENIQDRYNTNSILDYQYRMANIKIILQQYPVNIDQNKFPLGGTTLKSLSNPNPCPNSNSEHGKAWKHFSHRDNIPQLSQFT